MQDKLYNTARTGAEFKKCLQDTFAMVRTEQVTMLEEGGRPAQKRPSGWSGYAAGGERSVGITVDPF